MYNGEYHDIDVNTMLTADIEKPLNGVYIRWDKKGQLEEVSMFKDGQLHGEQFYVYGDVITYYGNNCKGAEKASVI